MEARLFRLQLLNILKGQVEPNEKEKETWTKLNNNAYAEIIAYISQEVLVRFVSSALPWTLEALEITICWQRPHFANYSTQSISTSQFFNYHYFHPCRLSGKSENINVWSCPGRLSPNHSHAQEATLRIFLLLQYCINELWFRIF
jgi:hypothetical protein